MIWLARLWLIDRKIDLYYGWRAIRRLFVTGRDG